MRERSEGGIMVRRAKNIRKVIIDFVNGKNVFTVKTGNILCNAVTKKFTNTESS
jgi:hypothetical protein